VLFGLLKGVLSRREELKMVVMSATLEAEKFQVR
jgi:HrpA-like RNA helicase